MPVLNLDPSLGSILAGFLRSRASTVEEMGMPTLLAGSYSLYRGPSLELDGERLRPRFGLHLFEPPVTSLDEAMSAWTGLSLPDSQLATELLLGFDEPRSGIDAATVAPPHEVQLVEGERYVLARMPDGTVEGDEHGVVDVLIHLRPAVGGHDGIQSTVVQVVRQPPRVEPPWQLCVFTAERGLAPPSEPLRPGYHEVAPLELERARVEPDEEGVVPDPSDGPIDDAEDLVAAIDFHRRQARVFHFHWVRAVQERLSVSTTGVFDAATVQAVAAFQLDPAAVVPEAAGLAPLVDRDHDDALGRVHGDTLAALQTLVGPEVPAFHVLSRPVSPTFEEGQDEASRLATIAAMKAATGDEDNQDFDDLEDKLGESITEDRDEDRDARARNAEEVDIPRWNEGGLLALRNELQAATFLGRTYVAHPMLIERLDIAEEYLADLHGLRGAALGEALGIGTMAGIRDGWSYHGLGMAVDVDATRNPFVTGEQFKHAETSAPVRNALRYRSNCELVRVLWHAVWFCGQGTAFYPALLDEIGDRATTPQIHAIFAQTHDALVRYLGIRSLDEGAVDTSSVLAEPPHLPEVRDFHAKVDDAEALLPRIEEVIARVQADLDGDLQALPHATARDWRALAAEDYQRLTVVPPAALAELRAEQDPDGETREYSDRKASVSLVRANFMTRGRDPDDGILSLPLVVVRALRDAAALAWGATDFAGGNELGDLMHFDLRTDPRVRYIVSG